MYVNEFLCPVSVDFAPRGSQCAWCDQPAERQLTAIGGAYHNKSGLFCHPCGERFSQAVSKGIQQLSPALPEQAQVEVP